MPHFLLRQDRRPECWGILYVQGVSFDALTAGLPMNAPPAPVRVTVTGGLATPADFVERPCVLVSDAMRRALDGAGVDNVEYFPAVVESEYAAEDGEPPATGYWIANVVGAVACADPAPNADPPAAGPDPRFRINARRAGGVDLFRLAEDRELLVVSERVAAALRAAGLRGVVLQDPEAYDGHTASTAPAGEPSAEPESEVGTPGEFARRRDA